MKNKKHLMLVLLSALVVTGCTGCGAAVAMPNGNTAQMGESSPQASNESSPVLAAYAEDGGDAKTDGNAYAEQFKTYEQFGMVYDAEKNELYYNGKTVRWFEDYYPLEDGSRAGRDYFNEKGVVDVYAVRDLSGIVRADDGSFDPSGRLTGIEEFSEEEFAARDIDAIRNPAPITAVSGDPVSAKELQEMVEEYGKFGVTYDAVDGQWYFNGEKVRYFRDILTSNGESLDGGKFNGSIRALGNGNGTVDIYTVRDYQNLNASGYGTLTGIEKYSQEEFDEHTRTSNAPQSSSGTCTVIQE